ncbi:MAG: family 65 glycosyl hydrolase [Bacteroides sp.]|nr:family 65 glycosyl hydrolase [Bacteroides sp.]
MKKYLKTDEWNIIEEGFDPECLRASESIFSLGNGRLGQRGNFEEAYTEDSLQGSYVGGITYADRTRVGWWKNGYPSFFSRVPNAPNWSGIYVRLIDEELDLAQWDVEQFTRQLDMKEGISYRDMTVESPKGHKLRIHVEHINSMAQQNLCLIRYRVTSINYEGKISLVPYINGDVTYEQSNFNEKMWNILKAKTSSDHAYIWAQVKREDSQLTCALTYELFRNGKTVTGTQIKIEKEKLTGFSAGTDVKPGDEVTLLKYTAIVSTLYCDRRKLVEQAVKEAREARQAGWNTLLDAHRKVWQDIWDTTDVVIEGDPAAQQGIRFNIFQLYQSYRGEDPRLNIGAKGFTGEKYGGNTQWNTELCCVPFFLLSSPREIVKNLLLYRYNQLPKAIENAEKLGFTNGAALYPMVTSNGEECHNEWEITFEEIHRNNIIAYAIDQYTVMIGSTGYVAKYGLEVLIAISRFWSQRVSFSQAKQQYVLLGVTGPNEYENNVNNNWYTNYSCVQCLKKAIEYIEMTARKYPDEYARTCRNTGFEISETKRWKEIIDKMYLPEDTEQGIFLQQEGYLDKVLETVDSIPTEERPVNQHWSWDRVLRSCFIKQSDVLLGMYLYYYHFDKETVGRNFHFYEPRTLHESSLSPFVHSILAARIGETEKAYDLFLRATRLDLDDYNNEVHQGLHVTSMAGSWLAIVQGFAQMQIQNDILRFSPIIPEKWEAYSFYLYFKGCRIQVRVTQNDILIHLIEGEQLSVMLYDQIYTLEAGKELKSERKQKR